VSLRYLETQPRASAKQLQWHDTLALVNIELIHKNGKNNVVPNAIRIPKGNALESNQVL
jgi:hypothetical protein